jgi:hypothetical protein
MRRALWLTMFLAGAAAAQEGAPAGKLEAPKDWKIEDFPNDNGSAVMATWKRMPYDDKATYKILVALKPEGPWMDGASCAGGESFKSDQPWPWWAWSKSKLEHLLKCEGYETPEGPKPLLPEEDTATKIREAKPDYWFKLAVAADGKTWESEAVKVTPSGNVFDWSKLNSFFYMLGFGGIILAFIQVARRRPLWIRRIPGLDAVDEAVGRATEMGRPIYYMTGRNGITEVSTVAATLILGEIAKKVAAYDTTLKVPHTDPIVMAVCQEITRESYISAGRPDSYRPESNFFVTDDQFGYTAAVDGMMVREKPAACFYMGYYYAESLLLAETGASTGAIQIAGTDADAQLPFFVTACDYTLIGEELYAAGAYLSKEPVLVGTLRGQDIGKAIILGGIVLMTIIATFGQWGGPGTARFVDNCIDILRGF